MQLNSTMASKVYHKICLIALCCFNIDANRTLDVGIEPKADLEDKDNCYAVVRTNDEGAIYLGASGSVSIYNPTVQSPQWSATRTRLQNGDDSIEAGWMVNEDLFKDTKTHLYIRYKVGGKGCFNLECPGFVQAAKDVLIGKVPDKISQRGQVQYGWRLSIDKHKDDGNWWLSIDDDKYGIGYWPGSLFTSLADHANHAEWGGEVYFPDVTQSAPQMGCGNKPDYDTNYAAFYSLTKLVNGNYNEIGPPTSTVKFQNCVNYYLVEDMGYNGLQWGRVILFGGPGEASLI